MNCFCYIVEYYRFLNPKDYCFSGFLLKNEVLCIYSNNNFDRDFRRNRNKFRIFIDIQQFLGLFTYGLESCD